MLLTFEPGDTPVGRKVREIVLDPATGALAHRTEALLYAADKAEHVETVVLPALERREVVVTDRYVDSDAGLPGRRARHRHRAGAGGALGHRRPAPAPDRRPRPRAGAGLGRFAERDRIEGESLEFHQRVREAFGLLAAADPEHYLVLDARLPEAEIAGRVRDRVAPLLGQAARR